MSQDLQTHIQVLATELADKSYPEIEGLLLKIADIGDDKIRENLKMISLLSQV